MKVACDFSVFKGVSQFIDLARTKSEALDNIKSLFKQNIKSCYAKREDNAGEQ